MHVTIRENWQFSKPLILFVGTFLFLQQNCRFGIKFIPIFEIWT